MSTDVSRLVVRLRELRARTGLSLAGLSARTAYSKSSWERYLNGRSLPPRQAVRDLCRIADEPAEGLLVLWEFAESQARGRAAVLAPATEEPRPQPQEPPRSAVTGRPYGRDTWTMIALLSLVSVCALLAGGLALVLLLRPGGDAAEGAPRPTPVPYSLAPRCHGANCEGLDPIRLLCGIGPVGLTTYRTAGGARVELRYSEKCGASWARAWGTRVGDRLEVTAGGPTHDVRVRDKDDTETYLYTAMVTAGPGSTVRACFRPASADGERECFTARVGHAVTGADRGPGPPFPAPARRRVPHRPAPG